MFIKAKKKEVYGDGVFIGRNCRIKADFSLDTDMLEKKLKRYCDKSGKCCNEIIITSPIHEKFINKDSNLKKNDAYVIEVDSTSKIYVNSVLGANYAISYISRSNSLEQSLIFDYPVKEFRGYKMFIPPKESFFDDIKYITDMLIDFRYNYIILEIGGAMEYIRRPEINKAWEELCADVKEYSGKGDDIALGKLYPWPKNVIHVDNGGGSFVSQKSMKLALKYIEASGIKVIPETPSLSHCDYLVRTYPEIRERKEDTDYPDTYCPSNPKTYEILFDVLDEIYDVFTPEFINIGHDELFSIGLCEKCKDHEPTELFVQDVLKIKSYLEQKNVRIMMWADMLSNKLPRHGGAGRSEKGDPQYVPPLFEIRNMLPRDIIMIDWWYNSDENHINVMEKCGYKALFGNLDMYIFNNYDRIKKDAVLGGIASNWGSLKPLYMQLNSQNFCILFNSLVFWNDETDEEQKEAMLYEVMEEAYAYCNNLESNTVEILGKTDYYIKLGPFYDGNFIDENKLELGSVVFVLNSGEVKRFKILFGKNVFFSAQKGDKKMISELCRLCGGALPVVKDDKIYYKMAFSGDFEKKDIKESYFEKTKNEDFSFEYEVL